MHIIILLSAAFVVSGAAAGAGGPASAGPATLGHGAASAATDADGATQGQRPREERGAERGSAANSSREGKGPAARGAAREQGAPSRAQQRPERSREGGEARGREKGPSEARETGPSRARETGRSEARERRPELDRSAERRARRGGRVGAARLQQGLRALPPETRRLATSSRRDERLVAGAVAHAIVRGLAPSSLVVRSSDDRVAVLNRKNEVLLDLDPRSARELGSWEVRRLGDERPHAGSPAFCASGAGHPVWGREWCIDKGFGLGGGSVLWSRGTVDDVIFRRRGDRDRVDGGSLLDVLGGIVFDRLALHALALGFDEPIQGLWVAEPGGPRLLRVYSGERPVAELMDADRDDRVEIIYVAQLR
jgi:hypothetical protein